MESHQVHLDKNLIVALQKGEEAAFCTLFHRFYSALCVYGQCMTNDREASEHIATDSFMKLWERKVKFSHILTVKAFLYTTVRNSSIDWLRKTRADKKRKSIIANSAQQVETTGLELLITAETYRELHAAISTLPTQCREVINLSFIEGKKLKEVATELNIAVGTVKSQKNRGLTMLKKRLKALHAFFF